MLFIFHHNQDLCKLRSLWIKMNPLLARHIRIKWMLLVGRVSLNLFRVMQVTNLFVQPNLVQILTMMNYGKTQSNRIIIINIITNQSINLTANHKFHNFHQMLKTNMNHINPSTYKLNRTNNNILMWLMHSHQLCINLLISITNLLINLICHLKRHIINKRLF